MNRTQRRILKHLKHGDLLARLEGAITESITSEYGSDEIDEAFGKRLWRAYAEKYPELDSEDFSGSPEEDRIFDEMDQVQDELVGLALTRLGERWAKH